MLPRFDQNDLEVVSLSQMLTAVANALSVATLGANFRINQTTNQLQILNASTGLWNPVSTTGANGSVTWVLGNGIS
jgi:hypothetical protein